MVWSGNRHAENGEIGCHEVLSLTQWQMKREPQCQFSLDRRRPPSYDAQFLTLNFISPE
jgi:hypothetical protein